MAMQDFPFLPWKVRPIFLSSTFKDMQVERDYLRKVVFPRVEDELRKGRLLVEPIDLRQGVETADLGNEARREQLVLKVCLEEIQRSRPFLIVLLGDRYGWVPPEDRVVAAAQEAGLATDLRDKSVTALEIEYGLVRQDSAERRRCLIYLREGLPYAEMPEALRGQYSDEYSSDPQVRDRHRRLEALKQSLAADPELGPRVHHYRLEWDAGQQRVAGLEAWGERVFEDLVGELQAELQAAAVERPLTWQEQEQAAVAEFIELRCRDFVGRAELLEQLTGIALSETSPSSGFAIPSGVEWGACVTGEPGMGKSALFAELALRLSADRSIVLLTNAAGGTPRGSQVDAILERFIEQLSERLGIAPPPLNHSDPNSVDATFASLLNRVAAQHRVVILLDALNQFEATPRGRSLTWLRATQWPANARLIATSLPGPSADALSQWAGIEELEVEPLEHSEGEDDDITAVAHSLWRRYHRQPNGAVLEVLKGKRTADGELAAGNPLWLTLALEQINLLDSDDFERAERDFAGDPAERLRGLLIEMAGRMPPTVAELYGWMLSQSEKVGGAAAARAFAAVVAISRSGWRESDLLRLIPLAARLVAPEESLPAWDTLRLAALRRSFRAHLTRHGLLSQLDFFHAQMRQAVELRILKGPRLVEGLHRVVCDDLESLPESDPLRISELMVHLIQGNEPARAARHYARLETGPALTAATQALAQHIQAGNDVAPNSNAAWIAAFLDDAGLTNDEVETLAKRFVFDLAGAIAGRTTLEAQCAIQQAAKHALEQPRAPQACGWEWPMILSDACGHLGRFALAMGRLEEARQLHAQGHEALESAVASDPANVEKNGVLFGSFLRLSEVAREQGDLAEYQRLVDQCHGLARRMTERHPTNVLWQSLLSIAVERLTNLAIARNDMTELERLNRECHQIRQRMVEAEPDNPDWQNLLVHSFDDMADLAVARGDAREAEECLRESLKLRQRLLEKDPANEKAQRLLAIAIGGLGQFLGSQHHFAEARQLMDEGHAIFVRLAEADPTDAERQQDLQTSFEKLGRLADVQGNPLEARRNFVECHRIWHRLTQWDPSNFRWQSQLARSLAALGAIALSQRDLGEAQRLFVESLRIAQRLAAADPTNDEWQRDMAYSHRELAMVAQELRDAPRFAHEARECYQILKRMRQNERYLVDPELEQLYQQLRQMFGDG